MLDETKGHRYSYWCWGADTIKELKAIVKRNGYKWYKRTVTKWW